MSRRVAIQLDLETARYQSEARQVAATTKVVDAEMGALGREVKAVERDMEGLAVTAATAKTQLDGLGSKARQTAVDLRTLDERIRAQRAAVAELGHEWLRTGDSSIMDKFKIEQGALGDLERARRAVSGLADDLADVKKIQVVGTFGRLLGDIDPAKGIGSLASGGASFAPSELKALLMPALIAVAVASAPVIGAVVAGAVTGAVGFGGIAGGIAMASQSPGVRKAARDFGATISSEFFGNQASRAFEAPAINALQILGQGFRDLDLGGTLAKGAPAVETLAHGLVDFATNVMPGVNAVMDKSGAISEIMARGFGNVGDSLGDAITDMVNSKGALEGLDAIFTVTGDVIRGVGAATGALGDAFHNLGVFDAGLTGWLEDVVALIPGVGHDNVFSRLNDYFEDITSTGGAATRVLYEWNAQGVVAATTAGEIAAATAEAKASTDRFTQALREQDQVVDDTISRHLSLAQAQLALAEGERTLKGELVKGKSKWKTGTEVGDANQAAVEQRIEEANRVRLAQVALAGNDQGAIDKANEAFNATLRLLLGIAAAAGDSKANLEALAKTYTITIETRVVGKQVSDWSTLRNEERKKGHAAGGWDDGSAPFWAGERGPELVFPGGKPSWVATHDQSMAYAGGQARTYNPPAGGGWSAPAPAAAAPAISEAALGRAMRTAVTGLVVVLDNHAVGSVQGREANILRREV
jgi:hypothetical protein